MSIAQPGAHAPLAALAPARPGLLNLLLDVLFAPTSAAAQIAARRRSLFLGLGLYMLAFVALWWVYYQGVDFAWLKDYLSDSALRRHPEADPSQVRAGMAQMSRNTMMASALVGGLAATLLALGVRAVYHHLLSKLLIDREVPLGTWMALAVWSLLPGALGLLLSLGSLLVTDFSHVNPGHLSLSSLNALVLHLPPGHAWSLWAESLDLTQLWTVLFMGLASARLLQLSRAKALLWAALPYLAWYGGWTLMNLR